MPKFRVKTKFIFNGEFIVEAETPGEAKEYVAFHCGMVSGGSGIHSSLSGKDVDWNFPVHPEKKIGRVKKD
jgi:hypothetical protein